MLDGPEDPRARELLKQSGHGRLAYEQPQYMVVEPEITDTSLPNGGTSAQFASANGGEYRKTYHGFTPGTALVINSPTAFQLSPMQIDTWHRKVT